MFEPLLNSHQLVLKAYTVITFNILLFLLFVCLPFFVFCFFLLFKINLKRIFYVWVLQSGLQLMYHEPPQWVANFLQGGRVHSKIKNQRQTAMQRGSAMPPIQGRQKTTRQPEPPHPGCGSWVTRFAASSAKVLFLEFPNASAEMSSCLPAPRSHRLLLWAQLEHGWGAVVAHHTCLFYKDRDTALARLTIQSESQVRELTPCTTSSVCKWAQAHYVWGKVCQCYTIKNFPGAVSKLPGVH